ncbi:hypothetical protein IAT40_001484 [Kwoniella sp. CBS 6097]
MSDSHVRQSPFKTLSTAASGSYRPTPAAVSPSTPRPSSTSSHPSTSYASPSSTSIGHRNGNGNVNGNGDTPKRRKISPMTYEVPSTTAIPPAQGRQHLKPQLHPQFSSTIQSSVQPTHHAATPSTAALLYHAARSAHQAAHHHLQQFFMPLTLETDFTPVSSNIPLYSSSSSRHLQFTHDAQAAAKALGLQLLALDFLQAGLAIPDLSDSERVAFALEFGNVGLKVYEACAKNKGSRKGKEKSLKHPEAINTAKLMGDMQDIVGQAYFTAQRQSSLERMRWSLELLNARLSFVQGKFNLGKRMVQQALTANNPPSHRYALYLLYLEYVEMTGSADYMNVINELIVEARGNAHAQFVQLLCLAKARFIFVYRRWELASQALQDLLICIETPNPGTNLPQDPSENRSWRASLTLQYIYLRSLWEGRIGKDDSVRALLKQIYALMDQAMTEGIFHGLKANGGIVSIDIPGDRPLMIQSTPPNILYLLTYLTTVTSRRDFSGSDRACRHLLHPTILRQTEHLARMDDMWDTGFSPLHGVNDTLGLRRQVLLIRAEMMLEYATALLFRSKFSEGYETLHEVVIQLRAMDAFQPYSPHICLLFAQHANLLGIDGLAARYYEACKTLINPDSELSLTAEICLLGSQNHLRNVTDHPHRQTHIHGLAEKCKSSTSAMLTAASNFLASLADENTVSSKKSLSASYEITNGSNNNTLRLLIFAFTTSTHHYGGRDRMFRQLETGRDLARLMGGKDREDGVGSIILGLWFALKLKNHFRQEGLHDLVAKAKENVSAHKRRLEQVKVESRRMRESLLAVCSNPGRVTGAS